MTEYDVIVAGGAMAGSTLALALSQFSGGKLRIAVIESYSKTTEAAQHPGFDSRCIALSYGTVCLLKRMHLWNAFAPEATAIRNIHVSDREHLAMTEIDRKDVSVAALGYVVELAHVGRIYQELLAQDANIDLYCPDTVTDITRFPAKVCVTLASEQQLQGKLLVAADGAGSFCCQQLGIEQQVHDFEQVAVIANVRTTQPHNGRAFERFTEHGPVALLPMSDNRMSLVWCLRAPQADEVMNLDDKAFLLRLQQDFGWRLGEINKVGSRASYPLALNYRRQNISHRFAIVGNAAQALHPIAGQGFNLGIRDVASLAEELVNTPEDVGQYATLVRYKKRREQDRENTVGLTSLLVHTFSNDLPVMRLGRNIGLSLIDGISCLKHPLLNQTLGLIKR